MSDNERARLISWAKQLADPNWCLSVPKEAKDVITQLVKELEPRTITTVEELDALGRGATVVDPSQDVWTNDGDTLDQWGSVTAAEPYGGPQWFGSADITLPVTVIREATL